jgi:regulator of sigma E protease
MLSVLAFISALALLIAVHEFGHYRMAVACGVRVLRFSIGFGKPLWQWKSPKSGTEFALAVFPLGGFVRMLDEREAPVDAALRAQAFNNQTLLRRFAIVLAGPLANLVLAVLLYSVVNWMGVQLSTPVLAYPTPGSLASQAGLHGGERVLRAGFVDTELVEISSFEDFRWLLTRAALAPADIDCVVVRNGRGGEKTLRLMLADLGATEVDAQLFEKIGIQSPFSAAQLGEIVPQGAAMQAGLLPGDKVLEVNGEAIVDAQQLRQIIRNSTQSIGAQPQNWRIQRQEKILEITVTPLIVSETGRKIGRIGAYVGIAPESVLIHYGFSQGMGKALQKTWDMSVLTLSMIGKMLIGEASVKNISGPLTIADYAGRSANLGLTHYLTFLALISVSLGVLNLLPLPVLDGGHLMYYLWEGVTGRAVSDFWLDKLQRGGLVVLSAMMLVALYNDVTRLFFS